MTDREKKLEKHIMEYSAQTIEKQKMEIGKILEEQQKDIAREVLWTFHQLFQKALSAASGKEVAYVVISFLNTGIMNDSIELKIDLYDSDILFDGSPVTGYYEFHYFDEIIRKDMVDFKNYIESRMIRVKYQELCRYRRVCMIKYKSVMEECMQTYAELMTRLRSFLEMRKTTDIKIVYGELMCKNTVLYEGTDNK